MTLSTPGTMDSVLLPALVSGLVSLCVALLTQKRKELRDEQERLYAPLYYNLVSLDSSLTRLLELPYLRTAWNKLQKERITFRITPEKLRYDLERFYTKDWEEYRRIWHLVQEYISKKVATYLNIEFDKLNTLGVNYLRALSKDIFASGNTMHGTAVLEIFEGFKNKFGVPFKSQQQLIGHFGPIIRQDGSVKDVYNKRADYLNRFTDSEPGS
jgi:hypothetical protein